jgi:nitrogen fixation-related uncharacterized protein
METEIIVPIAVFLFIIILTTILGSIGINVVSQRGK